MQSESSFSTELQDTTKLLKLRKVALIQQCERMTPINFKQLQQNLVAADQDKSGNLTFEKFAQAFSMSGYEMTEGELKVLREEIDD